MKTAIAIIVLIVAFTVNAQSTPSAPPVQQSVQAKDAGPTVGEQIAALRAQTEEMKRSADHLYDLVWIVMGSVTTIALALGVFSWLSTKALHNQDLKYISAEVREKLLATLTEDLQKLDSRLVGEQKNRFEHNRLRVIAEMLEFIGDAYLVSGNYGKAIDVFVRMYSAAGDSEKAFQYNAVDKLIAVMHELITRKVIMDGAKIAEVKKIALGFEPAARSARLVALVSQYDHLRETL